MIASVLSGTPNGTEFPTATEAAVNALAEALAGVGIGMGLGVGGIGVGIGVATTWMMVTLFPSGVLPWMVFPSFRLTDVWFEEALWVCGFAGAACGGCVGEGAACVVAAVGGAATPTVISLGCAGAALGGAGAEATSG
jgi:hypothetical protein